MAIIKKLKDFIMECPYLEDLAEVNVDFLPEDISTYSIEQTPSEPWINKWVDGSGGEKRLTFVFSSRIDWSYELQSSIESCGFFENFQNWMDEKTDNDELPNLGENMIAISIEAISSGYLFDNPSNLQDARYQIQCLLVYEYKK